MIERIFLLDSVDPVVFLGVNNANLQLLKTLYPKLRLVARGSVIKAIGEEEELALFDQKIAELKHHCNEYNSLSNDTLIEIIKGNAPTLPKADNLILFGNNGKPIVAKTPNQRRLTNAFEQSDLIFATGPAGTGKTYTAIALAVKALKAKQVRKIILSRPAVEAGEKLGFLPGEMKDKLDPYLQPLYDALQDMLPPMKLREYLENNVIQIAPLAYMRGRTLSEAVIILDEAQNTSIQQIKMFLTRLGLGAKMIINGDGSQVDLPPSQVSGLHYALDALRGVRGVEQVAFGKEDIVRHKLVQRIVEAFERYPQKSEATNRPTYQNKQPSAQLTPEITTSTPTTAPSE